MIVSQFRLADQPDLPIRPVSRGFNIEIEFPIGQSCWKNFSIAQKSSAQAPIPRARRFVDIRVKSIVDTVQDAYSELSGRERLVADFILGAPGEVGAYGASELARLVGVSPSTVTRPAAISSSARRRDASPDRAISFWSRSMSPPPGTAAPTRRRRRPVAHGRRAAAGPTRR